MIKINLQNATNGIIKTVIDNQYNGADQVAEIVKVYEIDDENSDDYFDRVSSFLFDITKDLCLFTGSDIGPDKLNIVVDWGVDYVPSEEEIDERIKDLKAEIRGLQNYKKTILGND